MKPSFWQRIAPGLTLMFMAPVVAEILPGATRFSSLFVLPIEMCVWGGGALLIREVVRRQRLGWTAMLLLGIALAVAEEFLIQQTSLAPMVLQLKGHEYARAFGVNYVYLLWALAYEPVLVVLVPIHLVELIFDGRRTAGWVSRTGAVAVAVLFVIGSVLAWFSWTQIARPKVFHVAAYNPPLPAVIAAIIAIAGLVTVATRRRGSAAAVEAKVCPSPWVVGFVAGLGAALWYGLVLLGFGAAPTFPPAAALGAGFVIAGVELLLFSRWTNRVPWSARHRYAAILGVMLGSMMVGFVGFIGASPWDLYFKVIANGAAVVLLLRLARRVSGDGAGPRGTSRGDVVNLQQHGAVTGRARRGLDDE